MLPFFSFNMKWYQFRQASKHFYRSLFYCAQHTSAYRLEKLQNNKKKNYPQVIHPFFPTPPFSPVVTCFLFKRKLFIMETFSLHFLHTCEEHVRTFSIFLVMDAQLVGKFLPYTRTCPIVLPSLSALIEISNEEIPE